MKTMIILGAGRGTRLGEAARDRPKCMVEIHGAPIAEWQLKNARELGVDRVVIVRGHAAESVQVSGAITVDNPDYATTNMVSSLWCAREYFGDAPKDTLVVSYGDILYPSSVLAEMLRAQHEMAVAVDHQWLPYWRSRVQNVLDDAETMKLDAQGRILDLGQKASSLDEIQGQYIGLLAFRGAGIRRLIDRIQQRQVREAKGLQAGEKPFAKLFMTDLLRELIQGGCELREVPIQGDWVEIDSALDLELAKRYMRVEDGNLKIDRSEAPRGRAIWITGLSGAGKSTLARAVKLELESSSRAVVWVDGDHFREILGNDLGHDPSDRLKNALRLSRFTRFLVDQGVDVVCSTMSLFKECQEWNRVNIPGYFEVFLDISIPVLEARDPKQLYKKARAGEIRNVVGVDLPFHAPVRPELRLTDSDIGTDPQMLASNIVKKLSNRSGETR